MSDLQRFVLKRGIVTVVLALASVSIIFVSIRMIPGTPYSSTLLSGNLNPKQVAALKSQYGLAQPVYKQYLDYISNVLTLNFGYSLRSGTPVLKLIIPKMKNTLILLVPALVVSAILSTILGMYAGWRRGSLFEKTSIILTTFFRSVPSFVTGIIFLIIFAYWLGIFPIYGMHSTTLSQNGSQRTYLSLDFLHHYILPFVTAVLYLSGDFLLLARNGIVEKRGSEFLRLHKAKGLSERERLFRAGRNSLLPLLTYFALRLGKVFQGFVVLETLFAWPGIGRELVQALLQQDYPVVQAAVFIMALAAILGNLGADIIYGYLDPNISGGS